MSAKRPAWIPIVAFPLFIALTLAVVLVFRGEISDLFRDRDALRSWIAAQGFWGVFVFIGLQVLQVVVFVIPGEVVQIAGGYVYGLWGGTALSLAGITLGSIFNFYAGRLLGRPFVEALFAKDRIESIERVTGSGKAAAGFFLLFVIPGIPKDALCYVAGISGLGFAAFFCISMFGRLPGILGSSFMGSAAQDQDYRSAVAVLAFAAVLFILGLLFKERIESFLARVLHRGPRE